MPQPAATPFLKSPVFMGILFGVAAYTCWGLSPLYFRAASMMSPLELNAQRVVWAFLLCLGLVAATGKLAVFGRVLRDRRLLAVLCLTAGLMVTNWLIFVYAIDRQQVMAVSLGYYINPLVAVLLGRIVLKERVSPLQWGLLGLVSAGVLVLVAAAESSVWLSLLIAFSWGFYALQRKRFPVDSLVGFTIEVMLLLPLALGYLAWHGGGALAQIWQAAAEARPWLGLFGLILLSGLVTTVPLVAFGAGQRRLTLASMGLLQYISPSLQFLLAVLLWGETFALHHAIAFTCIWIAVFFYSLENWRRLRAR